MKKHLLVFSFAILTASIFTSCNKGLKDDMKELEQKVADQQAQLEQEQALNDKYRKNLGLGCANATITTNDGTKKITIGGDYCLTPGNNYDNAYIDDNLDGTYYIYLEKASDVRRTDYFYIGFVYNSNTGEAYLDELSFSGESLNPSYNWSQSIWPDEDEVSGGLTLHSINPKTGSISFTYKVVTTENYIYNIYENQPMILNINYTGKLAYWNSDEEPGGSFEF